MIRLKTSHINKLLTNVSIVMLLLFVVVISTSGIFDTDIWLHLRTGREIVKNLHIGNIEPYSFTLSGKPWINHEWLFQVIVYLTYRFYNLSGLVALQTLFITLSFLVLFFIGFKNREHLITALILSMLAIFATRSRFNLRPDILSLMFFAIFLQQLKFNKDNKWIFSLVFWQLLWVNCHGYFFLGPLLMIIFISAELLKRFIPHLPAKWSQTERIDDRILRKLVILFVLVVVVCFLNPHTFRGVLYPLHILRELISGKASYAFQYVVELAPAISIKGNAFSGNIQFNILLLVALLSLFLSWRRLDITYILLFVVFLPFGLLALRNIAFLSFAAYVIIISRLEAIEETLKRKVKISVPSYKLNLLVKSIIICILIWLLSKIGYESMFRRYYDFQDYTMKSMLSDTIDFRYPRRCVDFILDNNLPANLFNDFNSGAYLTYHAWPGYKVFIDGRTELYTKEFFDAYSKIMKGDREVFDTVAERFNINTALLNNATSNIPKDAFKMFYEHPEWQLVFFDEQGVVFLKETPENKKLLKRFSIDLRRWRAPSFDLDRLILANVAPSPYLARARLLDILDLDSPLAEEAQQALKIMPSSSLAHFYLAKTFFNQGDFQQALAHFRLAYAYGYRNTIVKRYLAMVYFNLGNNDNALRFFEMVLEKNPKDKEVEEFIQKIEGKTQAER